MLDPFSIQFVGDADLDLVELVEDVEFGDRKTIQAVHLNGIPADHTIKPAAASSPSGGGSEFSPPFGQLIVEAAAELCGEWSLSHAGGVGLGHTDDVWSLP